MHKNRITTLKIAFSQLDNDKLTRLYNKLLSNHPVLLTGAVRSGSRLFGDPLVESLPYKERQVVLNSKDSAGEMVSMGVNPDPHIFFSKALLYSSRQEIINVLYDLLSERSIL